MPPLGFEHAIMGAGHPWPCLFLLKVSLKIDSPLQGQAACTDLVINDLAQPTYSFLWTSSGGLVKALGLQASSFPLLPPSPLLNIYCVYM